MAEEGGVEPHPFQDSLLSRQARRPLLGHLPFGRSYPIRTDDTFRYAGFLDQLFRPLTQASMVGKVGIGPTTFALSRHCSTY